MKEPAGETIAENKRLKLYRYTLGPFGANSYLLTCPPTAESLLIDTPHDGGYLKSLLHHAGVKKIVLTHGHADHLGSLGTVREMTGAPVGVHREDEGRLPAPADFYFNDGEALRVGNLSVEVLHTPGHTPGSVCFLVDGYLVAGDTVFPGGPGKTSTPGDFLTIIESIEKKIFSLPGNTVILPGHGTHTQVKQEKALLEKFKSRGYQPGLCGDVTWE